METELEKWNWNWEKVNFPKTSAPCVTHTHRHTHTLIQELGVPVLVQTAFPFSPPIISYWRWHCECVFTQGLTVKRFFFKAAVYAFSVLQKRVFALYLMERLQRDWESWKEWDRDLVCVSVWMSCSHAMIILWRLHRADSVCPLLLCGTISTLCDVQGRSSHNGNYVFSWPDWTLFFFFLMVRTKEPDREGEGRRTEGEVTCCTAAGWGGSVRSGEKRRKYTVDWFTFAYS